MQITVSELEMEGAELVPAREALAFVNWAAVYASNSSTALNVLTYDSTAESFAGQLIVVNQY